MKIFVSGTDTDAGKTFVSGSLTWGLHKIEKPHSYWKPIQTGLDDQSSVDRNFVDSLHSCSLENGYDYKLPLSPDQASDISGAPQPNISDLIKKLEAFASNSVIIEGAGGLYVPINHQNETWLDFLDATNLPTLLVARTRLGTINHTSLSIHAIEDAGHDLLAVVLSGEKNPQNLASLQRMFPKTTFIELDYIEQVGSKQHLESSVELAHAIAQKYEEWVSSLKELWTQFDKDNVWHPFTQHQIAEAPLAIERAKGIYLYTQDNEKLVDGNSSWWVNTVGHGRKEIRKAIVRQQAKMDHVLFAGATHKPASQLSQRIIALAASKLQRVFFSDNGSTAVEVGLKMAFQSFANKGDFNRDTFIAFEGSYHGDTFGTMSVASSDGFHGVFKPFMFDTLKVVPPTFHRSFLCPDGADNYEERIKTMREVFAKSHSRVAGVILEPLVQGASGMLMQPKEFLKEVESLCKQYGLPLIFDEVFTGLGRVGAPFAFQRAGVQPDIVCIAKGLTGGTMPMSLTLSTEHYFNAFLDQDKSKALLHGHSYTANAIACAAANATLDIYQSEDLAGKSLSIENKFKNFIQSNLDLGLENPRAMGAILAFEIPGSGMGDYFNSKATLIPQVARRHGLFLRPLGNTLYFIPPLTITGSELEFALDGIRKTVIDLK